MEKWEEAFEKMTPDEIPSQNTQLYGTGGVEEWLKQHSAEHLYENEVYGEPMCDISKDKVLAFIRTEIITKLIEDIERLSPIVRRLDSKQDGLHIIVDSLDTDNILLVNGNELKQLRSKWLSK